MKAIVSVDKVGRIVLPQEMREAIATVRKRGRRVYGGPLPEDWDSGEAVSRMRQQRTRR